VGIPLSGLSITSHRQQFPLNSYYQAFIVKLGVGIC
jgi:hypothetical protein